MNKYHNKKTEVDGYVFDSRKEASRYVELRMLEKAGYIKELTLQPKFMLQEGFVHKSQGRQRAITYTADFCYLLDGGLVVEDAKGMKTDVYKIKKKMFLWRYPEIEFKEV